MNTSTKILGGCCVFLLIIVLFGIKKEIAWRNKGLEFQERLFLTESQIEEQIIYHNQKINDVSLQGYSDNYKISEILNEEKLIIYLPQIDCYSCTSKEVEILKHIFPDDTHRKIIIITPTNNKREIKLFEQFTNLKTFGISPQDSLLKISLNRPTLFLAGPSMQGFGFFTSNHETAKLSVMYYQAVLKRFQKDAN